MISNSANEGFWKWFLEHEPELFSFEVDQERWFDRLATELGKVNPHLSFEFGPKTTHREFVISASGIKDAFPSVFSIVGAAPQLERWRVTAFRPRRMTISTIEIGDKRIDPNDVQFTLLDNGRTAGIYLFIPGYRETEIALKHIGYLMLDEALGEYDVEMRIGMIKMLPPDARTDGERHPLSELPALFDKWVSNLEGNSRAN